MDRVSDTCRHVRDRVLFLVELVAGAAAIGIGLLLRCSAKSGCNSPALTGSADVLRAEGVQWILLRNPVYIYGDDAKALAALMGDNYRPVQPLNGRVITTSV